MFPDLIGGHHWVLGPSQYNPTPGLQPSQQRRDIQSTTIRRSIIFWLALRFISDYAGYQIVNNNSATGMAEVDGKKLRALNIHVSLVLN
jgi:hypothetical protein